MYVTFRIDVTYLLHSIQSAKENARTKRAFFKHDNAKDQSAMMLAALITFEYFTFSRLK